MVRKTLIILSTIAALAVAAVWIGLAVTDTPGVWSHRTGSLQVVRMHGDVHMHIWRDSVGGPLDGSKLSIERGNVLLTVPYSPSEARAERTFLYQLSGFVLALTSNRPPPPHSVLVSPEDMTCGGNHNPVAGRKPFTFAIGFPLWFVFVAFAAAPTIAFIRGPARRWRRRKRGLCPNCGYDLTGTVSGVCSECAHPIAETTS